MKTENIHREVFIEAIPSVVYNALMDSGIHCMFIGVTLYQNLEYL